MNCEEIMIHDIPCCVSKDTLETASRKMSKEIGALPVCTSRHGSLVGIITEHDMLQVLANGRKAADTSVEAVMTRRTVACYGDDDLTKALNIMLQNRVERIPVVDRDGKPVGIVTLVDAILWNSEPETIVEVINRAALGLEEAGSREPERPKVLHSGSAAS